MTSIFATETGILAIFDPARLRHRLTDRVNWWWFDLQQQIQEMESGNALFFELKTAGVFEIEVTESSPPSKIAKNYAPFHVESGSVFVGSGDWTSGGGHEPRPNHGMFVAIPPGDHKATLWLDRTIPGKLWVRFQSVRRFSANHIGMVSDGEPCPVPGMLGGRILEDAPKLDTRLTPHSVGAAFPAAFPAGLVPRWEAWKPGLRATVHETTITDRKQQYLEFFHRLTRMLDPSFVIAGPKTELPATTERDDNGRYYEEGGFREGNEERSILSRWGRDRGEEMMYPESSGAWCSWTATGLSGGQELLLRVAQDYFPSRKPERTMASFELKTGIRRLTWITRAFLREFAADEGRNSVRLFDPMPGYVRCAGCAGRKTCCECDRRWPDVCGTCSPPGECPVCHGHGETPIAAGGFADNVSFPKPTNHSSRNGGNRRR